MPSTRKRLTIVLGIALLAALALILTRKSDDTDGLVAGFDAEFLTRPDGYPGLCKHYGFTFAGEPKQMDSGLMYKAIADGAVDVICGFATDGRIPAYDLLVLDDDKQFFPPYYCAPLVRADTLERLPQLRELLGRLAAKISDNAMQQLNLEVDEGGRKPKEVAKGFLVERGLVSADATPGKGTAGRIVVGGKPFVEQEILGEMMAILIECTSDITVERKLNLGGTMICFNALKAGDLDLYAEYTGTGLVSILKREVTNDADEAYATVKEAFGKQWRLTWLEPFGFNNTYTLTMRREHAKQLGIVSVSDLAGTLKTGRTR